MTWGETEYTQANGNGQRPNKVAVSPSRPMTCYVCLHLQHAVRFRSTSIKTRGLKTRFFAFAPFASTQRASFKVLSLPFQKAKPKRQTVSRKFVANEQLEKKRAVSSCVRNVRFWENKFLKPLRRSDNRSDAKLLRLFLRDIHET